MTTAPRWLLRDRDAIYGDAFRRRVAGLGMDEVLLSPPSPLAKGLRFILHLIGLIREDVTGPAVR